MGNITIAQMVENRQTAQYRPLQNKINSILPESSGKEETADKNVGGFRGGLAYLGHKVGLGALGWFEGIADYTAGGLAKLFGNDEWAEKVFANDWVNYNSADEWYNPDENWAVAGDVAQGIGNSLPSVALSIGLGVATGGASVAAQAALQGTTTFLTSGLSAAGMATKEAYQQTGKLGAEEFAYGAMSGAMEGAIETFSDNVLGWGSGVAKKAFGRNLATKVTRDTLGKSLLKGFAGEAIEEGVSAYFSPYIKRATYDPNAKNASMQEIGYSAFIGGLSGMIMGGGAGSVNLAINASRGNTLDTEGKTESVINLAENISKFESTKKSENEAFEAVSSALKELKTSLKKTGGEVQTVKQRMLLGYLDRANTVAVFQPYIAKAATNIANNSNAVAETINKYYANTATGEKVSISAEDLKAGIDFSSPRAYRKSLTKALKNNSALRTLTVLQVAGRLGMNTETFSNDVASGNFNSYVTQTNINDFRENATPQEMEAVSEALGIGLDEWDNLTPEVFSLRMDEFNNSGKVEEIKNRNAKRKELLNISEADAKEKIPTTLRATEDGAVRYKQGEADIGVLKEGDRYILHDYTTSKTSKTLTRAEAESSLNEIRGIVENGAQSEKTGTVEQENKTNKTLIRPGMTETERYKALKNRKLSIDAEVNYEVTHIIEQKDAFDEETFKDITYSAKKEILKKIGEEFDVYKKYTNSDTEIEFSFSRGNLKHSINKQEKNYSYFAKMLSCFESVVKNAIGVEVHNRNEKGYKKDLTLKNVYVLTSAFVDKNDIIPVKLEIKEFKDKKSTLYVAIALESINKDEVVTQGSAAKNGAKQYARSSTISISDFFKKINPSDKSFLKYIPDGFLNAEQKRAKQEALAEDAEKTKSTAKSVSEIVEGETESKVQTVKIDLWAKEHIKEYGSLNALNKSAVRATIRAAQKNKFDEEAIVTFARFASKSGLSVSFDKSKLITGIDEDGNETYANGMLYGNTVYVNPDSKIKHDILLIHELLHELITKKGAEKLIKSAVRNMDKNRQKEITERYLKFYNKKNKNDIPHNFEAIIVDEITAHYAEEVFSDIDVLAYLDEKDPTIKDRIIGFFNKSARAYSEDSKLSATARKFARQYRKLFNEVAERNYQGNSVNAEARYSLSEAESVDNSGKKEYNEVNQNNSKKGVSNGREETTSRQGKEKLLGNNSRRESISFSDVNGRIRSIHEVIRDRKKQAEIASFGLKVYQKPTRALQDTLIRHAKKENVQLFFVKWDDIRKGAWLFEDGNLFVSENISEAEYVDILDIIKPIDRDLHQNKVAHISEERKNKFLKLYPDAYLTRIPIQQFLGMTTENNVELRLIHSYSSSISRSVPVENIKNTSGEYMYLEVDMETSSVISHDGRHRMMALLNAGNAYADVFVIAHNATEERYSYISIKGQFNSKRHTLSLIKANSRRFAKAIDGMFWRDDGNIRYSLPDEEFDSPTLESVAKEREKRKISWKEKFFSAKDSIYIDTVDEMYGVEKYISKYGKNKYAKALVQQARASRSQAQTMIGSVQYDVFAKDVKKIGKGIHQIMKPIRQRGAENVRKFEDYMLHRLNVDRMTLEERSLEWTKADREALEAINGKLAQNKAEISRIEQEILNLGSSKEDLKLKKELQSKIETLVKENRRSEREAKQLEARIKNRLLENKPVFGENEKRTSAITAEESREIVAKYEKIHTEWNSIAEEIYSYLRALNHMRVEAGLISAEQEAYMNELYPHYVPAYRDFSYNGVGAVKGSRNLEISSTLRKAKGGGQDITEFERIIAEQTQQLLRAGRINQLANAVYESALDSGDTDYVQVVNGPDAESIKTEKYKTANTNESILELINKINEKQHKQNDKIYFDNVSPDIANKIFELTGVDVTGFKVAIEARQLEHILIDHGKNGKTDKSMSNDDDVAKIEYVIEKPDSIVLAGKTQAYSYMKNGYNRTAQTVLYEKEIGDKSYYVVQAVPDTQAKTLYIVSAFIGEKGYKKSGASQLIDVKNPDATSNNGSVVTPVNSISENSKKINSFDDFSEKLGSQEEIYDAFNRDTEVKQKNKENQITFYRNGEKITMNVSREIFIGFEALNKPTFVSDSAILNIANKINNAFKKIVTSYSPAFLIRNPIRDIQDAGLNSKHPALMAKNIPIAFRQMWKNSELWQQYRAYGGWSSTVFDANGFNGEITEKGFNELAKLLDFNGDVSIKDVWETIKKPGKKLLMTIENVNAFIEQVTRFSEFLASIEAGDSIETAIYNSAEVTTNFGRRGRITKVLNATFIPFLNPAIQGFDKMFRNVKDAVTGEHVARALATLLAKAAVIGILPMLINMLMYGDDEDYEDLREEDKENNFLIKRANGTFIKIPRGRVASVIGGATNRISRSANGRDADVKGYIKNAISQVTPIENFSRSILSPFTDVKNNLTWYGTEIEGREFENTAPKDRYDESTSSIAIFIGKRINYSPKKIHYLLDQYSGVIGDVIFPVTTNKAEKGFFSGNFTIDPATSNKLSTKFYELYDETQYAKTAGDDTAIYQVKYLNRVKSAISEMYDQISEIQNSELSNAEKLQQTRVIRILINEAYKTAIQDYDLYTKAIEATASIKFDEDMSELSKQNIRFAEATRLMYGAERALKEYDEKVYTEAQLLNKAGLGYDSYYSYYFSVKGLESDKDKNGNTVSGSKRKKVVSAIESMNLSTDEELLFIASHGYSLTDAEKRRLLKYILSQKMTKAEKEELAEKCGFKVKNGKIILK